jgi:unsaturated rhamnogalacturonyl hydrolase
MSTLDAVLTALLTMQRQSWEQGVAAQAALDLHRHDLALLLADAAVTRQAADGRLGDVAGEDGSVNGAACGEAVLVAARRTGEDCFAAAARRQLEWLERDAPRAADGTLFHLLSGREVWVDTVYMVVPFMALAGRPELAVAQLEGHRGRLCRDGLYSAIWSEDSGTLRRADRWGGGNGWVVAGIARALRLAPELRRTGLGAHAREVLDACLALRRPDGLFHDVLDDPTTFVETNAAQMFAYAALVGAADGWLPPSYADAGRDLLAAAARTIDELGRVTGACGSPTFDHAGTSAEAQAFHLLAAAAAR